MKLGTFRCDGVPMLDLGAGESAPALYPMTRAENAQVAIRPQDRKYGVLSVGGQGSGKTSLLLSLYRSDTLDTDAAMIVADAKSELARVCLAHTPPECGKRVWYLDRGRWRRRRRRSRRTSSPRCWTSTKG